MMSQPYVHGITETLTHDIASSLTAGHIAADGNTLSVAVVCADRWFPGDVAVITSGGALAGQVADMDVCTGGRWGYQRSGDEADVQAIDPGNVRRGHAECAGHGQGHRGAGGHGAVGPRDHQP